MDEFNYHYELLKITDKIKSELAHISDQIKLKSVIIETKDIFKIKEKALLMQLKLNPILSCLH